MRKFFFILINLWSFAAFAIHCDCEVRVFSPMTGSNKMKPVVIEKYELEEFSNYAIPNVRRCRRSCLEAYQNDMPIEHLRSLLITHSIQLIEQKAVGYNCTGLTTLRYPVRVKAKLGEAGLGNVSDIIEVVTHEEVCF